MGHDEAECLICLEAVERVHATWQCPTCYAQLHLACLQAYVRSALAPINKLLSQIIAAPLFWHCPHCRSQFAEGAYPARYTCFCGKALDPEDDAYLPPHTCGDTCGRGAASASCPHPCVERCHAGPCAKCSVAVDVACHCGRTSARVRCGTTAKTCGARCGRVGGREGTALPCTHACPSLCHEGRCGPCSVPVLSAPCACGAARKTLPCSEAAWQCGGRCGKALACGAHACSLPCHSGPCSSCPAAVDAGGVRTCSCGKEKHPLLTCTDAAPKCGATCDKARPCGHACAQACHEGGCGPCPVPVEATCKCGKSRVRRKCGDPQTACIKLCSITRNCGRHACKRKCCPGAGGASTVGAGEGAAGSGEGVDGCPPCREVCSRMLPCGSHACAGLCHAGPCAPCPKAVSLSCPCGGTRTSVPCGLQSRTGPPRCTLRCRLPLPCSHKSAAHACHSGPCPPCRVPCGHGRQLCVHPCPVPCHGGAECAPCAVPVPRACVGGHSTRNLACSAPALFRCEASCGASRACGKHACPKPCHGRSAACTGPCGQACGEVRGPGCSHTCAAAEGGACHPGPCPPCGEERSAPCHCGVTRCTTTCAELTSGRGRDWRCCGKPCARSLRCGHGCPLACHSGTCSDVVSCSRMVTLKCACRRVQAAAACATAARSPGVAGRLSTLPCDPAQGCMPVTVEEEAPTIRGPTAEEVAAAAVAAAAEAAVEAVTTREAARRRKLDKQAADTEAAAAVTKAAREAEERRLDARAKDAAASFALAVRISALLFALIVCPLAYVYLQ